MPDYILKADTYEKQSKKWRDAHPFESLKDTHILMPKYDGCHCLINTTTLEVWSREMKPVLSMQQQAMELAEVVGPGHIVQGEAWYPGREFPEISGAFRRFEQSDLIFVAYNILTVEEFTAGYSDRTYRERNYMLSCMLDDCKLLWPALAFHPGTHREDPAKFAATLKEGNIGYDGAILTDPNGLWATGRSRNGELIKVKPSVSLDLRVTDVSVKRGEKTGRDVFVLTVRLPDGKLNEVGSGVPHNLYPSDYMGKIVEIEAMGWTPSGYLREPRFKALRPDKEEPDT